MLFHHRPFSVAPQTSILNIFHALFLLTLCKEKLCNTYQNVIFFSTGRRHKKKSGLGDFLQATLDVFIYNYVCYYCLGAASAICSSSSCFWSMAEGASSMTSRPLLFFGKAMQSRMESRPAIMLTKRSRPKARPA